jgi:hypothetical protein
MTITASAAAVREGGEAQRKLAEDQWKELLPDKTHAFLETDHFLFYGTASPKILDECGKAAEKSLPFIKKALRLDKDPAWKGKPVIFVLHERSEYTTFERNLAKRNPDREDRSGFFNLPGWTLITVGPATTNTSLPYDLETTQQVAAAALTAEHGTTLPEWVQTGFGRSIAYRLAPKAFTKERQLAADYLRGRSVRDVLSGNLTREQGPVLNGSLVDYLAHGVPQNPALFQTILIAFGLTENGTMEQALTAVRVSPDAIDAGWRSWVTKVK